MTREDRQIRGYLGRRLRLWEQLAWFEAQFDGGTVYYSGGFGWGLDLIRYAMGVRIQFFRAAVPAFALFPGVQGKSTSNKLWQWKEDRKWRRYRTAEVRDQNRQNRHNRVRCFSSTMTTTSWITASGL